MKIKSLILTFFAVLIVCLLSSCGFGEYLFSQSKKVNERFVKTYDNSNINAFCIDSGRYALVVNLQKTKVIFELLKDVLGNWNGTLSLIEDDDCIEEIPISLVNNEIVIHREKERRISADILFFCQFDTQKASITRSAPPIDMHEEVQGLYPVSDIQIYLSKFYEEIISNLDEFASKDDYFVAISNLEHFLFVSNVTQGNQPKHSLTFGFSGNNEKLWNPNHYGFERVSMLFYEIVDLE